jgi:hypothetical protein
MIWIVCVEAEDWGASCRHNDRGVSHEPHRIPLRLLAYVTIRSKSSVVGGHVVKRNGPLAREDGTPGICAPLTPTTTTNTNTRCPFVVLQDKSTGEKKRKSTVADTDIDKDVRKALAVPQTKARLHV